jgi:hypothetical protein
MKQAKGSYNIPSNRSFHTALFSWETVSAWMREPNLVSISSRLISAGCKYQTESKSCIKNYEYSDNQQRKLLKTKVNAYLNILRWFNCSWRFGPPSTISFLANPWFSRRCLFVSSLTKRTIAQSGTIIVIMSLWAKFNVNDKKKKRKK